jgi:Protein of unknown function (DUF2971)
MLPAVTPDLPMLLEEWDRIHNDPPAVLYHYTTAAGLMGIIASQRLWATNARFLNDPSEIRYALKMISDTVAEREKAYLEARSAEPTLAVPDLAGIILGVGAPKIEIWAKDLLEVFHHQREVYVTSFCEDGDLLSQWRGYASAGGGYAIGIAAGQVWRTTSMRPPVILRKVIYDPETQRRIVSRWMQSMFDLDLAWRRARRDEIKNSLQPEKQRREQLHEEARQEQSGAKAGLFGHLFESARFFKVFRPAQEESLKRVTEIQTRVTQFLAECLITFKDPAYRKEREWRAIQFGIDAPAVKFRNRGGNIVPYVELDLAAAEGSAHDRLPIRAITYGPTLEPDVSDRALKMLCSTAGYNDAEVMVCQSSIPYRGPG